jgi:ABC-2 type transport system ATP-binding protein
VIELDGLTMRYRARTAVQDLTVQVLPGRVTAFLGPNGSGRTTTMRCVLGLTRPTSGAATVLGVPYAELAQPIRRVRALIDLRARHPGRIAHDHLRALAQSNALPRHRVDDVIELVGLDAVADERVRSFSLGMAQRLGIAFALLGDPRRAAVRRAGELPGPRRDRWVRHLLCGLAAEGAPSWSPAT